jgi:hypothetical protein
MTSTQTSLYRHNPFTWLKDNVGLDVIRSKRIMAKRDSKPKSQESGAGRYDDELLHANWNPVVDLLRSSSSPIQQPASPITTKQVSEEDAAAFLGRIYKLGN